MRFTATTGCVPAGSYRLRFETVEPFESDRFKDPAVRWEWLIVGGDLDGKTVSRITQAQPTPKNACGKIITGLTGKAIRPGDDYDVDSCVGKIYLGQVGETESGSTRVETIIREQAAEPAPNTDNVPY